VSKRSWWKDISADRAIELFLSCAIAFFAAGQLINSCTSSKQTDQLIRAAWLNSLAAQDIADASQKNATAAEHFSISASSINGGISDAVGQLKPASRRDSRLGENQQGCSRFCSASGRGRIRN